MMLKRPLVLTTESARHPFRRSLPPHVFARGTAPAEGDRDAAQLRALSPDDSDWKLFMLSFAAFFTAFYGFIF